MLSHKIDKGLLISVLTFLVIMSSAYLIFAEQ